MPCPLFALAVLARSLLAVALPSMAMPPTRPLEFATLPERRLSSATSLPPSPLTRIPGGGWFSPEHVAGPPGRAGQNRLSKRNHVVTKARQKSVSHNVRGTAQPIRRVIKGRQ